MRLHDSRVIRPTFVPYLSPPERHEGLAKGNTVMPHPYVYENNPAIRIDGSWLEQYSGLEDKPAIFINRILRVLDTIWSRPLGKAVLKEVGGKVAFDKIVVIEPFQPWKQSFFNPFDNASDRFDNASNQTPIARRECIIKFSPEVFTDKSMAGTAADEILLHEFLHMFDDFADGYKGSRDRAFEFPGDFLTITATNVYTASADGGSRPLRHDHRSFKPLSPRFLRSPRDYSILFWENLKRFKQINPRLHRILADADSTWNPFAWDATTSVLKYRVVVKSKSWTWNFVLLQDFLESGRAYWEDDRAIHQFGFGTWSMSGSDRVVKWDSEGSWDILPVGAGTLIGKTRTGGSEYETEITRVY